MRTTHAAAITAALLLALTGCSGDSEPTPAKTVTVTKTPELSAEEARAACVDAWADTISSRPADWDPETGDDPEPAACAGLPEDDWTDRYMDGLHQSNKANIDRLDDCLDDPTCTSFPLEP
ncbi:hypothetical protein ACFVTT_38605 [Streptomyces niveus]|uniref:hypothetical protein n=1 Tax=Streptomyces niveus TaxID=193462 RepID=UPI00343529DD